MSSKKSASKHSSYAAVPGSDTAKDTQVEGATGESSEWIMVGGVVKDKAKRSGGDRNSSKHQSQGADGGWERGRGITAANMGGTYRGGHRGRGKALVSHKGGNRDRGSAKLTFPSQPVLRSATANVKNPDTWAQVCYWLNTIDLVALLMTGSRWMSKVMANTRDVKWNWYYYPILHTFKHLTIVDLSIDVRWTPSADAIPIFPSSVTSLRLVTTSASWFGEGMKISLPPSLSTLHWTTLGALLMNTITTLPDSLTDVTVDLSLDSNSNKHSEVAVLIVWLSLLPPSLGHLHIRNNDQVKWSAIDITALPRSLISLSIATVKDAIAFLPPQLLTLNLICSSENDPSVIALLPRTLTSLKYNTYFSNDSQHWPVFIAGLPPYLTELSTTYYNINNAEAFQKLPLKQLTLYSQYQRNRYCYQAMSGAVQAPYDSSSNHAEESKLTLVEMDPCQYTPTHSSYGYTHSCNTPIPVTVKKMFMTMFDKTIGDRTAPIDLSQLPFQFTTLECVADAINTVILPRASPSTLECVSKSLNTLKLPKAPFFQHMSTLILTELRDLDCILRLLNLVNRNILSILSLKGSVNIRLQEVMLVICNGLRTPEQSLKRHMQIAPGKRQYNRSQPFTALRSLVLDFMDGHRAIAYLDSYTYSKRFELPQGLEQFTVSGCSDFTALIFPSSLTSLTLDGMMVPYPSLRQVPRLQVLVWKVRKIDSTAEFEELISHLPAKLEQLTISLHRTSTQSFQKNTSLGTANDMITLLKAQRARYLRSVQFTAYGDGSTALLEEDMYL